MTRYDEQKLVGRIGMEKGYAPPKGPNKEEVGTRVTMQTREEIDGDALKSQEILTTTPRNKRSNIKQAASSPFPVQQATARARSSGYRSSYEALSSEARFGSATNSKKERTRYKDDRKSKVKEESTNSEPNHGESRSVGEYIEEEDDDKKKIKTEAYCILCQMYGHTLAEPCVNNARCFACGEKGHVRKGCWEDKSELEGVKPEIKEENIKCKEEDAKEGNETGKPVAIKEQRSKEVESLKGERIMIEMDGPIATRIIGRLEHVDDEGNLQLMEARVEEIR